MLPPDFIKPRYDKSCFSSIPQTIASIFAQDGKAEVPHGLPTNYETVILFFIDAFGWRFVEQRTERYPFLKRLIEHGALSRITSQFPSTTAAHVTTIHTGLPVGQHGVFEWHYYEPQIDAMIAPLLFSYAGDHDRETLRAQHADPQRFFPARTLYQQLNEYGVSSFVFQPHEFAFSSYSQAMLRGATTVPYKTFSEALVNLCLLLDRTAPPSYFCLYFNAIDAICHLYGPTSPQLEAELDTLLTTLDRVLGDVLRKQPHKTLVLLTADHGQTAVDPNATIYLNRDPALSDLLQLLKTNTQGAPMAPGGSPRDMFLYIRDGLLDEAYEYLSDRLAGCAVVRTVDDLIQEQMFGSTPVSATFRARAGDLVILPTDHNTIWWYEPGRFEQTFLGHHGGLTAAEMEIPLFWFPIPT